MSTILDAVPAMVWRKDADGKYVHANKAFCDLVGIELDALKGKSDFDVHPREIAEKYRGDDDRVIAEGNPIHHIAERHMKSSGQKGWSLTEKLPYFNENGEIIGTIGFALDITDLKLAEEKLRKSKEQQRILLDNIQTQVWYLSGEQSYGAVNKAHADFLGFSPKEIAKKDMYEFLPQNVVEVCRQGNRDVFSKGQQIRTEEWVPNAAGEQRLLSIIKTPKMDGQGDVEYVVCAAEDITDRRRAEEALRASEEKHRRLFETMAQGVIYQAVDGAIISANPAAERILGLTLDQMQGKTSMDPRWRMIKQDGTAVPGTDHPAMIALRTGETVGPVVRGVFHPDKNAHVWLSITATPLFQPGETKPFQVYAAFEDITERKRAEEQYQMLFREMLDGFALHEIICDESGEPANYRFLAVNPAFERATGLKGDDIIGKTVLDVLPETEDHWIKTYGQVALTGEPVVFDNFSVALQKHFVATAFRPSSGQFACIFADITDRMHAEEALRESEARFRNLFEHVPTVAVQGYGMDGKTLFWNKASEMFYGFSSDEAIGKNLLDLIIPDEMRPDVVREIKSMSETGISIPAAELHLKRKDGSRIQVYSSHAIVQRPNQPPELFCIDIDLTELKQIEQALIQAKEHAEAANQAKSEFLANMSHEIRTPINGMMGMMQLLETTSLDGEQKKYVQMAKGSANRLTRLLSDILDLSRVEAGKMTIHESEFVVQELADSVSDLFQVVTRDKGIHLECFIDPDIPTRLIGDEARVRQILFNLTGNALKFTNKGSVKVEMTSMSSERPSECRILLTVSDTGIGIPEDKLDGLFKPFAQVDGSYTRSYQGAGLGLSIVKRLVDLMGGSVSLASTLGKGTTVQVLLPFKLPEGVSIPTEQGPRRQTETKQSLRILLAEDEESSSFPTRKLLEKAGHTVTLAEDGQQALNLLAAQDFDVILMDVQMPVLNGVEATQEIRRLEDEKNSSIPGSQHSRIPIIALTAYAMLGDREKFLAVGMDDYLGKPVKMEDLTKVLERVVSKEKA
ncbi:PAS domain S-box protein [Desulfonatronum sp. SC1]|uniref:PAS domain S-box protein n=1 Tax=Desulfonatronum sp. SC1 TaxID=2109626 RepID=UPI0034D32E24